jgi:predicted methyltransferase
MRRIPLTPLLALLLGLQAGLAAAADFGPTDGALVITPERYQAVLDGDWRSDESRARDVYRHPEETLKFFGLRRDQTVIEITPGSGWYSELLAPLLSEEGEYVAAVQAPGSSAYAAKAEAMLKAKFTDDLERYGRTRLVEFDPRAPVLGPPNSADMVLSFRNVHNWVMNGTAPAMFKAFYAVLKPGGTLGIVDHRAAPGADQASVEKSGYLPTQLVVRLATDAGFTFAGDSEINANPRDTKDYPDGVWALPPTLRLGDKDRQKYLDIGESDRMTLLFLKPASGADNP